MKKILHIIIITLLSIIMITNFYKVQAFGLIKGQGDNFIKKGSNAVISEEDAINQLIPIGRILVQVATVVLVIVGLILGIKYMTSGADEKANVKQKLIWYVISVALVYGAVGIFNIVRTIIVNVFK